MGEIFYEYRFLLRDSMVLIALYPSFKENFVRNQEKKNKANRIALTIFLKENIIQYEENINLERRAKMHWFITAYWQSFASSTGNVSEYFRKKQKKYFLNL